MSKLRPIKITGLALFVSTVLVSNDIVQAQEKTLNRSILLSNKIELPSASIDAKVIRVTFPPAFKTPWHTHEGPGPRYVVKGKLTVVEGGKANTYAAGDVFWESGNLMSVENVGEDIAEIIIFEMAPVK
jgi:quercetin dioxygenase-like cupin family protein